MKTSSITIQREIDSVGGERVAAGDEANLWKLGDGRLVIETNGDPVWENEGGFREAAATILAQEGYSLDYRSDEWRALSEIIDWEGMWPEVDGDGCLRGSIVTSGEEGYLNVGDEAMIAADTARRSGWRIEGGDAKLTGMVDVEFATADETIRDRGGLDEFAGLEHTAMQDACAAYRAAAVDALRRDRRSHRLNDCTPTGQRILASQWAGCRFTYGSGAIGTMAGDLTEGEKAAIDAAHDAGREAARKVIAEADAAEDRS